jgi:UDP-N-acetylglucosamine 2-epimerase (non-hydrolysing)
MKVMTVLGTRPEMIRLSCIIAKLDQACDHILVHTGQNFLPSLSDIFFRDLRIRKPDYFLDAASETFAEQLSKMFSAFDRVLESERPDLLLVLGDTNSGLCSLLARRRHIPVYHLEAGNRCYDDRVPEELNRRVIDHASNVLMPYTHRSKENLLREGIENHRIFVVGNPINEVINAYEEEIRASTIHETLGVEPQKYFLVTMHRSENVDDQQVLLKLMKALDDVQRQYELPVIVSTHPRTVSRMRAFGIENRNSAIRFLDPFGFFDFIQLERRAYCVLTDSGTVQEECALFGIPNVTIRDVTERPETIECGSNILSGSDPERILRCVGLGLSSSGNWSPPAEYVVPNVSSTVLHIVLGYNQPAAS